MCEKYYKDILNREFEKRLQRNSYYSLRSYARDLDIAPCRLSEILNEKQGLSVHKAEQLLKNLPLSAHEKRVFLLSVESNHARRKKDKLRAQADLAELSRISDQSEISLEYFKIIEDWYHLAIVELTSLDGFQSDPFWIAKKIGITEFEANQAVKRLLKIGLLDFDSGTLVRGENFVHTSSGVPSQSIRNYHEQIMNKALNALHFDSIDKRDFGNINFKFNKNDLPALQSKIQKFRREILAEFRQDHGDSLYTFSTQLFRLDREHIV